MGKFLVAFLATMAALWILAMVIGANHMKAIAFYIPHFHTAIPVGLVAGGLIGFSAWRIVKGK